MKMKAHTEGHSAARVRRLGGQLFLSLPPLPGCCCGYLHVAKGDLFIAALGQLEKELSDEMAPLGTRQG